MKKQESSTSLPENPLIIRRKRTRRLEELEDLILNFYVPYADIVDKPYSYQEQKLLVDIIEILITQLQGTSHYVDFGRRHLYRHSVDPSEYQTLCDEQKIGPCLTYFRLALDVLYPFCACSRCCCLQQLHGMLIRFFHQYGPRAIRKAYTLREQKALTQTVKLLIRQLRDTPHYRTFVKKRPVKQLPTAVRDELRNQQRDEARLQFIKISHYNPLSSKYKEIKRLSQLQEKGGD